MRVLVFRVLTVGTLSLVFLLGTPSGATAQQRSTAQQRNTAQPRSTAQPREPRAVAIALEPLLATEVEALLAEPNTLLATDYYYIDLRFGPNLRMDAVVVEAIGSPGRARGLRIQVRDSESRGRQDGTSYMDFDELTALSRALTPMADRAAKWTDDERRATELTFTSAGGFRLAIRQSARQLRAYLSTGLLDPVATSIDISDLDTLKVAFDEAIAILNRK
jgi:hypothetical protein